MSGEHSHLPKGTAIVTGAAQGIGRAIALRLADDGYDIAVNDIPSKTQELKRLVEQIVAKGRRAISVPANVASEEQVRGMVEMTVEKLGGLDVMVANAGILGGGNLVEASVEQWNDILSVNVMGTMLCYKYAAKQMIVQGRGGRMIAASSLGGKQGISGFSAYCASKFAVRGLTQSTAKEFGPHNITVNAYAPGVIDTGMAETATQGNNPEIDRILASGCLPRIFGQPAEVAHLVSFLVSKDAYMITGQTVSINGGRFFD